MQRGTLKIFFHSRHISFTVLVPRKTQAKKHEYVNTLNYLNDYDPEMLKRVEHSLNIFRQLYSLISAADNVI